MLLTREQFVHYYGRATGKSVSLIIAMILAIRMRNNDVGTAILNAIGKVTLTSKLPPLSPELLKSFKLLYPYQFSAYLQELNVAGKLQQQKMQQINQINISFVGSYSSLFSWVKACKEDIMKLTTKVQAHKHLYELLVRNDIQQDESIFKVI